MKRIVVIDGQGGGLGKAIIERLRREDLSGAELIAVGTNALATAAMLKGGADAAASGESAICWNSQRADIIVGAVGILACGSMLGELSAAMASAIGSSPALKVLIPLNRCNIQIAGLTDDSLPARIDQAAEIIRRQLAAGNPPPACQR
jgi:hypothetical protein